jgi:hypothetical protein
MSKQIVHRLAMLTAIVTVTGALFNPCRAGIVLNAPPDLAPGSTFRFVFETDGSTTATSSNIADYDNFVNAQANGATYDGQTVTWQAIGSTASVDAITHIGVNPNISGVYLVTGQQVATGDGTSAGGLWSGAIQTQINVDIASNTLTNALVWTGSDADGGGASSGWVLGNTGDGGVVVLGGNFMTAAGWVSLTNSYSYSTSQMYAISSVLTVAAAVPEPSSGLLALIGISAGLGLASYRKCKGRWRQDPVGPSGVTQ